MSNQDAWIGLEEGTTTQLGSCCWSHVKNTLAKPLGTTENWITFVSRIVSIFIDPLFCYVVVINDEKKFLDINITLLIILLVIFVVLHAYKFRIYLQLELSGSLGRNQRANFILAEFITPFLANGLMMYFVISRTTSIKASIFLIGLIIFLVLNSLRISGINDGFTEAKKTTTAKLTQTKFITMKILGNVLFYLYGGHLFGGLWYLIAVWKKMDCWNKACRNHSGCYYENRRFIVSSGDNKFLNDICFTKTEDTIHELGIFKDALVYRIVESKRFWKKFLYCFRWGVQNLSGFGQNLEVSTHPWENILLILIVIYGMGTFTYFIGINMQTLANKRREMEEEEKKRMEEEEKKRREEEENKLMEQIRQLYKHKWFPFRKLSEKLQNFIVENKRYNWQQTEEIDVETLLSNLPENLQNDIKRCLCLDLLTTKVEKFGKWSEALLLDLCHRVKPVVYTKGTLIVGEGEPIDKMLFVLQGKLWTDSSRDKTDGSMNNISHKKQKDLLKAGDFWGEELVNWVHNEPSSSEVPNSERIILSITKVEAFVLMSGDLIELKRMYDKSAKVIQSCFHRRIMTSKRNERQLLNELINMTTERVERATDHCSRIIDQ